MKRSIFVKGACIVAVALATHVVTAAAPPAQYQRFDVTSTTICDQETGLRWDRAAAAPANYLTAKGDCPVPRRLPTVKELLTLVDEDRHREQRGATEVEVAIDGAAFPDTPVDVGFWTDTLTHDLTNRFTVHFGTGETGLAKDTDERRVRCVQFVGRACP